MVCDALAVVLDVENRGCGGRVSDVGLLAGLRGKEKFGRAGAVPRDARSSVLPRVGGRGKLYVSSVVENKVEVKVRWAVAAIVVDVWRDCCVEGGEEQEEGIK